MDADCGAVVAGLPADRVGPEAGSRGLCSQIPVFLFAPLCGIVADRSNRKHVVIGGDVDAGGGGVAITFSPAASFRIRLEDACPRFVGFVP